MYGLEQCDTYLTVMIIYLELLLSKHEVDNLYILPPFLVIVFGVNFFDSYFPCHIDDSNLNVCNIVTRIYVLTYLTIRVCHSKFASIRKEEELSEQANLLNQLREDELKFMKRFSHFTRTCLNGIVNFVSFLRVNYVKFVIGSYTMGCTQEEEEEEDPVTSCFDTVETSSSEILRQSNELVEYFEIRKGRFLDSEPTSTASTEITDVDEVLGYVFRVQTKLNLDLVQKKRSFVKFIPPAREPRKYPRFILFCRQDFSKIMMNITSNALKYTEAGHVRIDVEEQNCPDDPKLKMLVITAVDTGIGIKKDVLDRIFLPFVRNNTGKQSFSIGLVITKSIIERAGGTIEITSSTEGVNKGTKVTVRLPFKVPEEKDITLFVEDNVYFSSTPSKKKVKRRTTRSQTDLPIDDLTDILVVEDNVINQKVIVKHIENIVRLVRSDGSPEDEKEEVRIHVANDGMEGLEILASLANRNPLVLTDIDMPRLDGKQFCRRVRERTDYGSRLVIFAVTATLVGNEKEFTSTYGFDGVARKPVYFKQMIIILRFMALERQRKIALFEESEDKRRKRNVTVLMKREKTLRKKEKMEKKKIESKEGAMQGEVTIKSSDADRIKTNIAGAILFLVGALGVYYQPFSPIPEEYRSCWWDFFAYNLYMEILLYLAFFIFRFSVEVLSFLSLVIFFFSLTVFGNELCCIGIPKRGKFVEFSYIMRANESLESFTNVVIVTLAFYFNIIYYELTRPSEYLLAYDQDRFFLITDKIGLVFLFLDLVMFSKSFVAIRSERRRRWEKTIEEMLEIEEDYNMTSSKVSHDLSTPASALVIYLDETKCFLQKKGLLKVSQEEQHPDEKRMKEYECKWNIMEYFCFIQMCSFQLEISTHNFLACCKIRNGMVVKKLAENIFFASFIQSTVDRFEFLLEHQKCGKRKRRKVDLICRIDPKLFQDDKFSVSKRHGRRRKSDVRLCVDMVNINLIVTNLLFNAICHSKTATRIEFSCLIQDSNDAGGVMLVEIRDDGVGIDRDSLSLYDNLDTSHKLRFKERFSNTLGLGLTVCKYIASLMEQPSQVRITKNDEDSGTTVKFHFPFEYYNGMDADSEAKAEEEDEGEELEDGDEGRRIVSLRSRDVGDLKILCVDDDVIIGSFMRLFLTKMGFSRDNVVVENHEKEAIKKLQECHFDVLISDLNLVSMKFPEMICRVPEKCIPKVVFCASGSPEDLFTEKNEEMLKKKKVKISAVISKPFNFDSLRNCLRSFVDV